MQIPINNLCFQFTKKIHGPPLPSLAFKTLTSPPPGFFPLILNDLVLVSSINPIDVFQIFIANIQSIIPKPYSLHNMKRKPKIAQCRSAVSNLWTARTTRINHVARCYAESGRTSMFHRACSGELFLKVAKPSVPICGCYLRALFSKTKHRYRFASSSSNVSLGPT